MFSINNTVKVKITKTLNTAWNMTYPMFSEQSQAGTCMVRDSRPCVGRFVFWVDSLESSLSGLASYLSLHGESVLTLVLIQILCLVRLSIGVIWVLWAFHLVKGTFSPVGFTWSALLSSGPFKQTSRPLCLTSLSDDSPRALLNS